jgi:hypothetical protein
VSGSRSNPPLPIHTVLLTDFAIVPRGLTTDNGARMPQPRESRRLRSGESSQAQVLSYAADSKKSHSDKCDGVQAP